MARITVVSAGHMSHCPRMLKAADAFHAAGHDVRVVSTLSTGWAMASDRALQARRGWRWTTVDYTRDGAPARWLLSGIRARAASAVVERLRARAPRTAVAHATSRVHAELVRAILAEPADLIYAGSVGGIAPVLEASRVAGVPCGIDFEDFHCGEHDDDGVGRLRNELAAMLMADACRTAAFVTAGSAAIARATEARFGRPVLPINNVFPLPVASPAEPSTGPLRLYWFSQTIGPGRGLEDVVEAACRAGVACELHLRGVAMDGYVERLAALASGARSVTVVAHAPCDPDEMVDSCRGFDCGVAAESGHVLNRALALTNKALTYPLAGLAMLLTSTEGQAPLAASLDGEAVVYRPGDVDALADGLARLAGSPDALRRAREASWEAARTRWRWEHALERDALLAAVEGAIH